LGTDLGHIRLVFKFSGGDFGLVFDTSGSYAHFGTSDFQLGSEVFGLKDYGKEMSIT
jgi:hypothetical protein